jgi:hypothetical protein
MVNAGASGRRSAPVTVSSPSTSGATVCAVSDRPRQSYSKAPARTARGGHTLAGLHAQLPVDGAERTPSAAKYDRNTLL